MTTIPFLRMQVCRLLRVVTKCSFGKLTKGGGGPVPAVSFVPVMAADIFTTKPYQHQFGRQNAAPREAMQWCTPFTLPELGIKCT